MHLLYHITSYYIIFYSNRHGIGRHVPASVSQAVQCARKIKCSTMKLAHVTTLLKLAKWKKKDLKVSWKEWNWLLKRIQDALSKVLTFVLHCFAGGIRKEIFIGVIAAQFIILYAIFEVMMYPKQAGFIYKLKEKCSRKSCDITRNKVVYQPNTTKTSEISNVWTPRIYTPYIQLSSFNHLLNPTSQCQYTIRHWL